MDRGLEKFTVHLAKSPFTNDKEKQKAYRKVFGDELGSKVLQDILKEAGWFSPYVPNPRSPDNMGASLFDQGKKFVCYTVLNTMSVVIKEREAVADTLTASIEAYEKDPIEFE
ncbi:MAG: hypothetical protein MI745_14080 [Pseudomonadales bacterium]|nr:hypothetical protein [Pseudomonadales bacterium]